MHVSREGKAPQRDVTAVDNDPRCEFNLKLEPAIKAGSGVKATAVDSGQAAACAAFLQQQWKGSARLGLNGIYLGGQQCQGYASYPKTLLEHDAEEQASHTLLISNALLPLYREKCPGFEPMEQQLVAWLAEEFGVVAELANGHVLRQSQATLTLALTLTLTLTLTLALALALTLTRTLTKLRILTLTLPSHPHAYPEL